MLVKDYDLNFTFEISDDFTEISKDKYDVFGVDEDTLHYFLYLDQENQEYPFSLIKGKEFKSDEEYEKTILGEVEELQKLYADAYISDVYTIKAEGQRRLDRVSIDFNDGGFMSVVYYTPVNGHIVTSAASIIEDADEYEAGLYKLMSSIKEMN